MTPLKTRATPYAERLYEVLDTVIEASSIDPKTGDVVIPTGEVCFALLCLAFGHMAAPLDSGTRADPAEVARQVHDIFLAGLTEFMKPPLSLTVKPALPNRKHRILA